MPIIEIEVVLQPGEQLIDNAAGVVADKLGDILGSGPGHTWVKLRTLAPERYAENGDNPPDGVYPIFVTLLKAKETPIENLQKEVDQICDAIAGVFDRPAENVHLLYLPPAAGRIAFGGKIVPKN
jgi:hypothetical protein